MAEKAAPLECANCGVAIPRGAKSCPACGADERTGWREQSVYDDLDLPDEAYDDGESKPKRPPDRGVNGIAWYWWCAGVAVVLLFVLKVLGLM
jgi:hypothetical protein